MSTTKDFAHLQRLSCIEFSQGDQDKIGKQVSTIVDFLGKLNEISIDQDILDGTASDIQDHDLLPISGVIDYVDTDRLFQNVKHEKINNSILIKSVIEE